MAETHTLAIMLLVLLDYLLLTHSKGRIICGIIFSLRKMCTCWPKVCYLYLLVSFVSLLCCAPTLCFTPEISAERLSVKSK